MGTETVSPEVIAAIISAITAIAISLVSGLYVLFRSRREIRALKTEVLTKLSAESVFQDRTALFEAIRRFQGEMNPLVAKMNAEGQTEEGNHLFVENVLAFYAETVLPFYEKHREVLKSKSIDRSVNEINDLLEKDSANPHDPNRVSTLNALVENIQRTIYEVRDAAQGK